jgi:hypothetical protein
LTLRPPTNWPRDIPTHTIYPLNILPLWQLTTVTLRPSNILLQWQMGPVTFYYCDIWSPIWYVQVTNVHPPKSWTSCNCIRMSTFLFPGLWQDVHFCYEAKCGCFVTCHQGTPGSVLGCFMGGGQNVTLVKIIISPVISHPPESVCGEQKLKG